MTVTHAGRGFIDQQFAEPIVVVVGHGTRTVTEVSFSVSLRGWLRALAITDVGMMWLDPYQFPGADQAHIALGARRAG